METYPLVMSTVCELEHGHRNSEFSHENRMVIFRSYVSLPEGKLEYVNFRMGLE